MKSNKILLIILPYYEQIFNKSIVKAVVSKGTILLGLAAIAASLKKQGVKVKILDLNLEINPDFILNKELREFFPDYIGISLTTPLFNLAKFYARLIKSKLKDVVLIAGGPHPTVLPEDFLKETDFDIVIRGEGDESIAEVIKGNNLEDIRGISYKKNGRIFSNSKRDLIAQLDNLEFPALDLYEIGRYIHPKAVARRNPVASIETSRGCFGKCSFCNKSIFEAKYRMKSPERVIEEMQYILSLGFKEIHIVDDLFTGELNRAKTICEAIIRREVDLTWYPRGGLRVDRIDKELTVLMKRAGCYRIPLGIESGSQQVLDKMQKMITLEQVRSAVNMAKNAGLEVEGYFMLGLPGETNETIQDTLDFSLSLNLDYAKYAITVPLPGTPLFDEWDKAGYIKTHDWSKYNFAISAKELYNHPTVSWRMIEKYYKLAPRRFYWRPKFIARRFIKSIRAGTLWDDIKIAMKVQWF